MQLNAIDLNLLVVLDAVLATRSVKSASAQLGLSASATSHALARLRDALDDELLVRAGKALVPTPRAARLAPALREHLEGLADALEPDEPFAPERVNRALRIGTTDFSELTVLAPLSSRLATAAPGLDLHAVVAHNDAVDGLRAGHIDFVIGVLTDVPDDVGHDVLFHEGFTCLLRAGHPALNRRWTMQRYAALSHVLVAPRGVPRGVVDVILAEHGLERRVARTVASFLVAPYLVCETDYVLTVAAEVGRRLAPELGLVMKPPPLELSGFDMRLYWHRKNDDAALFRWVREQVAAALA